MTKLYKDIFLVSRGYKQGDWVGCEVCGITAVDVHHILSSARGKRTCRDDGSDLIALCREHHNLIHSENNQDMRNILLQIVQSILTIKNGGEVNTELKKLSLME